MKRFKIIGSYNNDVTLSIFREYYNEVTISLCKDNTFFEFGVDRVLSNLKKHNIYPKENAFDLMALALLVFIADTRISRELHAQDSWTREICIELPVADKTIWSKKTNTINQMLKFLTGDIWNISFTERQSIFADSESEKSSEYDDISLFSGGMDSLISTINQMEKGKHTLLAAHASEPLIKKAQTDIISELDRLYPDTKHTFIDFWTSIPKDLIKEGGEDNTTRSRSFLFIAYATFIASGTANLTRLIIPENGLIAINVPMDSTRVGAHSTRTTHPFYLSSWNELLRDLDFDFQVENIYWNKTKGEMAKECLNKDTLYDMMPLSMSCSSPGKTRYHGVAPRHCGYCLPCIIRRAAMHKAFRNDNTTYDITSVEDMINDRDYEKGVQIRSLQYAIQRIKDNPSYSDYAIMKPGPLAKDEDYLKEMSDVYSRGMLEVDHWIQNSLEKENAD